MIFKFLNSDGTDITNTVVNIGLANNIILDLLVDGESQQTNITGNLFCNAKKIGDFIWSPIEGYTVNWYMGQNRPIYVRKNDVIKATITSTPSAQITVTVNRLEPDVLDVDCLSRFIGGIKDFAPLSNPRNRLTGAMAYISTETTLAHSIRESVNIRRIKEYIRNRAILPTADALIFGTTESVNNALLTIVPPTPAEIFSSWARFSQNDYYPKGSTIPPGSEAAAWYWDDAISAAVMPLNTNTFCGFVSDELVDYYDHEATLTSTNGDDDWNGLVLAFDRASNGVNHTLSITASCDGTNGTVPTIQPNLQIRYNYSTILKSNSNNDIRGNGWSGKTKRIKVSRRGDQFTIQSSRWSEYVFDQSLTMEINLTEFPQLERFRGPKAYGYCNISQPYSSFGSIKYYGGILRDTIIDAVKNQVYRYKFGVGWQLMSGVTAQDVYGAPRALIGTDAKSYMLEIDGSITFIN